MPREACDSAKSKAPVGYRIAPVIVATGIVSSGFPFAASSIPECPHEKCCGEPARRWVPASITSPLPYRDDEGTGDDEQSAYGKLPGQGFAEYRNPERDGEDDTQFVDGGDQ